MLFDPFIRRAKFIRIRDADTYLLEIDMGYRAYLRVPVRVRNLWMPELGTPEGEAAAAKATKLLSAAGAQIVVRSYKDTLSHDRWIADVYIGGESMIDLMARPE